MTQQNIYQQWSYPKWEKRSKGQRDCWLYGWLPRCWRIWGGCWLAIWSALGEDFIILRKHINILKEDWRCSYNEVALNKITNGHSARLVCIRAWKAILNDKN